MKAKIFLCTVLVYSMFTFALASPQPKIQLALLLDTSNSMDGLINQAKSQLWRVVNEFALAKHDGERPQLEIALFEYGNDGLPGSEGHIRQVLPLTSDLDKISEELFSLTTNGGNEYCGHVIQKAVQQLNWSESNDVLKVVFIAGNEPFTQGDVDFRKSCPEAIARGIIINTIFCGNAQEGIDGSWKEGADLADGSYMNIDQNQVVVHIDAPQDSLLAKLNLELNDTYIPFGRQGSSGSARQSEQDFAAGALTDAVLAERTVSKSSHGYKNTEWDLVDAIEEDAVELEEMAPEALPAEMQNLTPTERSAYVEEHSKKRREIQQEIQTLGTERRNYLAKKQAELAGGNESLDTAIIAIVREQAMQKNFVFE